MSKELVVLSPDDIIESGISGFNGEDLPVVIQGQIEKLNELDEHIKKAKEAADVARNSASNAKDKSAGFGKKKVAIEELQTVGIDLAEAVQTGVEAQKISFEFHTKLAKITKYLFGLGVSNIASNRFVIRELEMKLKGASQEELSELARQELISVVKQLKEQEDILRKQENISHIIKIHDKQLQSQAEAGKRLEERLVAQAELNRQYNEQIKEQKEIDKLHNKQLKIQAETDKRLEEKLQLQAKIEKQHSDQLKIQAETSKRLEEQFNKQVEIDSHHGELIQALEDVVKIQGEQLNSQSENISKHDEQLVALKEINNNLTEQIDTNLKTIESHEIRINMLKDEMTNFKIILDSKANNTLSKITLAIAIIGFVISVIHFYI